MRQGPEIEHRDIRAEAGIRDRMDETAMPCRRVPKPGVTALVAMKRASALMRLAEPRGEGASVMLPIHRIWPAKRDSEVFEQDLRGGQGDGAALRWAVSDPHKDRRFDDLVNGRFFFFFFFFPLFFFFPFFFFLFFFFFFLFFFFILFVFTFCFFF